MMDADWHSFSVADAIAQLNSHPQQGLSSDAAAERSQIYGANELEDRGGRSPLEILKEQFEDIMLLMLIAVAVVAAVLDLGAGAFPKDAIAIFIIVGINAALGYMQESRAEKSLAALKRMASPQVRVVRDGQMADVKSSALVPGDILLLEAGMQVAADARLLEVANLQVQEAALTGEAHAVSKVAQEILPAATVLGDRLNLVFQGTEVVQGRGKAIVTKTGNRTELGQIAELLQGVETEPTPLQKRMDQLGTRLVFGSLALVLLVIGLGLIQSGWSHFQELLEVSLSMAVAVVPEGLPAVITVTLALGTQRMVRRHALIRKLPAVETLGSVTTICSDKTGTLTQNKMVVQSVHVSGQEVRVTGGGYAPEGEFFTYGVGEWGSGGVGESAQTLPQILPQTLPQTLSQSQTLPQTLVERTVEPRAIAPLPPLLLLCVLCNDAALQKENGEWAIVGDPTEGALLTLAAKGGVDPLAWNQALPRVGEV
ncbi:MAG: HAD-IC family P-type ATPase, partial [Cyanothece sp. SIO2G6]|nr:HAD-IC family P-type ATPase [Cyanothece sp. SIO2G6]